jgi:hypothetical protein
VRAPIADPPDDADAARDHAAAATERFRRIASRDVLELKSGGR